MVERSIRPIAPQSQNMPGSPNPMASIGSIIASLIETKLNGIDPRAYLTNAIARIANDYSNSRIDELLSGACAASPVPQDVL